MSKHRWNQGGNSLWIFDFAAQIRVRIFLKDGALSSLSKKIHAKSAPPKKSKVHANLKHFPMVSLGARPWCGSLLLDASISMLINQNCKLIISVLGTSSDTTQMAPTFSGQTSPPNPFCNGAALTSTPNSWNRRKGTCITTCLKINSGKTPTCTCIRK